ncbi:hypothetical protein JCM10908_004235 [Rhodotorula pacifica]|uniref:uncharacterized protein n=1 Tax=Rhodotorula pacifica TaxID=1495444 RepID=UPI00316F7112
MDEPGFHARRRAEHELRLAAHAGTLGHYGIQPTAPLDAPAAYPPSGVTIPPSFDGANAGQHAQQQQQNGAQTNVAEQTMTAPDLSNSTVPVVQPLPPRHDHPRKMRPYLQLMTNVMLRYDTVVDGIWHGFAMVVATDSGSDYSTPPWLTYQWDATGGGLAHVPIHELPRPGADAFEPGVESRSAQGFRYYVHNGLAGSQSFWRFKIEIPLGQREEEIFYSVNGGPENSFWIPAREQQFRVMYHSCNGFSSGVDQKAFNGPDPLWRDVLLKHAQKPIHVMVGGGDQLYCDPLTKEPEIAPWINETDNAKKIAAPLTAEMDTALHRFFFNWYTHWFRSGAFGIATGRIPMLNMLDDHDMIDGFGSYPDDLQQSPVFSAIGAAGYKWFLIFQMFLSDDVDGATYEMASGIPHQSSHLSKALIVGGPGAFMPYPNHSFLSYLGPKMYILMIDWRSERRFNQLASQTTYDRCEKAIDALPPGVEHLVVLVGVPIAYPRMVALEQMLEKKLNPMTVLAKIGVMPSGVNKFNAEAELKDDLADHPCSADHKQERNALVLRFQNIAQRKRLRISFMSGDVHATANSQFKSTKKVDPAHDPKFMLQIISSAIVNTPPPPPVIWLVSKLGKKTHKTLHHADTNEELIPLFTEDTDGSKPKSTTVMGRRNYCMGDYDNATGEVQFTICVEKSQGSGTTKEYPLRAPPPRW